MAITENSSKPAVGTRLRNRLLWFIGLWLAGVSTVAAVAYVLRAILLP